MLENILYFMSVKAVLDLVDPSVFLYFYSKSLRFCMPFSVSRYDVILSEQPTKPLLAHQSLNKLSHEKLSRNVHSFRLNPACLISAIGSQFDSTCFCVHIHYTLPKVSSIGYAVMEACCSTAC